jgi:mRNA-degrading endonuclease RelE of RelBE toxin-antitoxin system
MFILEIKSKIVFGDKNVLKSYKSLKSTFEEKQLKEQLDKAFRDLEKNAFLGIQVLKRLIPKDYHKRFGNLDNLWKYNLPGAWRLMYTVKRDEIVILSIVLDWLSHKEYERRFKF